MVPGASVPRFSEERGLDVDVVRYDLERDLLGPPALNHSSRQPVRGRDDVVCQPVAASRGGHDQFVPGRDVVLVARVVADPQVAFALTRVMVPSAPSSSGSMYSSQLSTERSVAPPRSPSGCLSSTSSSRRWRACRAHLRQRARLCEPGDWASMRSSSVLADPELKAPQRERGGERRQRNHRCPQQVEAVPSIGQAAGELGPVV